MAEQACHSTQHCVEHEFCHRCAPALAEASKHLVKALQAAGVPPAQQGQAYRMLASVLRNATPDAPEPRQGDGPLWKLVWPIQELNPQTGEPWKEGELDAVLRRGRS